jgi:hypothetical protein
MAKTPRATTVGLVLTIGLIGAGRAAGADQTSLSIPVWVRNRAEVPNSVLSRAQAEVKRIFRKAGVATVWVAAPHDKGSSEESPLIIDILSRDEADRHNLRHSAETLGATPTSGFERGRVAYVFYHRIGDPSRDSGVNRQYVLGIAMAHELGHLLLPYGSHSTTGLMRADWTKADLLLAVHGRLLFTAEQGELIRSRIGLRQP